nr:hypothetical protein [Candidatus Sigynarchaeota archaeon]
MDDEEKVYWLKIILGSSCGLLSIFVIPQSLVDQGIHVGLYRLLWLLGTWLGLPIPLVILGLWRGWLGVTEKEKNRREETERKSEQNLPGIKGASPVAKLSLKESLKKIGGIKFILKTGIGAFFFLFMLVSTTVFTLVYPFIT